MIADKAMDSIGEVERERSAPQRTDEAVSDIVIQQAKRMDEDAWSSIVDLHYNRLHAYLNNRTRNSAMAEDLVSQVFTEAVARIGTYENRGLPFAAWLFRIARNLSADHFRKQSRQYPRLLDTGGETNELAAMEREVEHGQVREALVVLTDEQRQVLDLRVVAECSVTETAAILGKSEGAIKAIQHRALASMRRSLHRIDPQSWRQDHGRA